MSLCIKGKFLQLLIEKLAQIMPDPNYDVVIYVVEDNISEDFLYDAVDDYNRNYSDFKFIARSSKKRKLTYKEFKQVTENTI